MLARAWSTISSSEPQFHADLLWTALSSRTVGGKHWLEGKDEFVAIATAGLGHAWAFAGLVASQHYVVVDDAERQLGVLEAARIHWERLLSVGPRYTQGSESPGGLEGFPTLVGFCLARQGAPLPDDAPMTLAHLDSLLADLPGRRVRDRVAKGKLEEAGGEIRRHHDPIVLATLAEHLVSAGHAQRAFDLVKSVKVDDPSCIIEQWLDSGGTRTP